MILQTLKSCWRWWGEDWHSISDFSGVPSGPQSDMLQTVGATNTAIVVTDPHGKRVKFDGATATGVSYLVDGDNTIHFTAAVRKDGSGNPVTEGAFSAVANFNLTYQ